MTWLCWVPEHTHSHTNTNLFLNDVALAGCVEGLLPLGLCGLSLLLLLLFSELLDPLQLLLDRSCLDCHHVPNLCRRQSVMRCKILNTRRL